MDPKLLIPSPDTIPVAWPWFKALLIPCFVVHLLFMNTLLGTGIIGWFYALKSHAHGNEISKPISRRLPFFMAFTINFGVAALLFVQVIYGHLFYTSSILMGVWWLAVLALVLIAYAVAYWLDFGFDRLGMLRPALFTLLVLCLLAVAFVFVNNLTMMVDPSSWQRYFEKPGGTLWHWNDPTLIPRYLHFVTASVAVGGLALALLNRAGNTDKVASAMHWFTGATAVQLIIGGWFFMALPQSIRMTLVGGDPWASSIFAISLLGVMVSLFFGIKTMVLPALWATCATVVGMVLVRDAVRTAYLAPYFNLDDLVVNPDVTPMLVFGLFTILGVAAVAYMLKLWRGGQRS